MFIIRRLSEVDVNFEFYTGNKIFDEKNPDRKLTTYINEDIIKGGDYYTYLCIEKKDTDNELVLGLLRYKFTSKEFFLTELIKNEIEQDLFNNLSNELNKSEISLIYLSRIGVMKEYQDKNIGQIMSNYFEYLIKSKHQRTYVYAKVIERYKDFIAPSYDFIAYNEDIQWGN